MTSRRRKAATNSKNDDSPKPTKRPNHQQQQKQHSKKEEAESNSNISIQELYQRCIINESTNGKRRDIHIQQWEESGAVAEVVWPFLVANHSTNDEISNNNDDNNNNNNNDNHKSIEFVHACHLLVLFISHNHWEGSFTSTSVDCIQQFDVIETVLDILLHKTDFQNYKLQTQIVHFLIVALSSDNSVLVDAVMSHVSGIKIIHTIPKGRQELELRKNLKLRKDFASVAEQPKTIWIVDFVKQFLHLLEGQSTLGSLLNIEKQIQNYNDNNDNEAKEEKDDDDADKMTIDIPEDVWDFLHRSLELFIDLLSMAPTRLHFVTFLDSIHFGVRGRLAVGNRYAVPEHIRLIQQLLSRINSLLVFPIQDTSNNKHLSKVDMVSVYHNRATTLQKMAHVHFPSKLQQVIYGGVGLLCSSHGKNSYLERSVAALTDDEMKSLLQRLRLIEKDDEAIDRIYLLQVLSDYVTIPPYPSEQLKSFPLFPTETMLWDHNIIPPSNRYIRMSPVLSLPKLNRQFLSFQDYLLRNFELLRLESAYEIRSDLVNVMTRVRPALRESHNEDSDEMVRMETTFSGWSRMALEMVQPINIIDVKPPKLGDTVNSQVIAEVIIDLNPCGRAIRQEWDEIGEFDCLFLVGVDASKMNGQPAPLLKDFHLRHSPQKRWGANDDDIRIPNEEDYTFPDRFGITLVRGCMVLQVRDEEGNVLSDPAADFSKQKQKYTKRIYKVALDPTQYTMDRKYTGGTERYKELNLVVRRHGRENNFRSVLETTRGLMDGVSSVSRVIPPWLQTTLLGYGDPSTASYKSNTIKSYAERTAGVNKSTDYLDFGDTFLNETHLRQSFPHQAVITIDGRDTSTSDSNDNVEQQHQRFMYKVRINNDNGGNDSQQQMSSPNIDVSSRPFPPNIKGNLVKFTPLQVEAIRSGLSPGLTMVVGPPGTGKTDVAVQIIANLYHSYPSQRTVIITHSNAALNDIFEKVMSRGDIDERYMVRLGAGERDLNAESSHDFTKMGRVAYSLQRRATLLEDVQQLSESLGISSKNERGSDGTSAYTCETADLFNKHYIRKLKQTFFIQAKNTTDSSEIVSIFPFTLYFESKGVKVTFENYQKCLESIDKIFIELSEFRPFELLRSQRQRGDYLIMKQTKIVAMTCTHAAIVRSHLIELGFEYDNIVVEEAAQMLEIETFIPMLLQRGESDDSSAGLSRLKRICLMGDHHQLPPVVKNASFSKFSNYDQSMFSRLIRLGVPYIQLDKQGRARPELARLYSWRYKGLGNLDHVLESNEYKVANSGFVRTCQFINVDDYEGKGETTPTPYFYQNLGEAEYAVAIFQFMVLIGYSPKKISILTTYNGQKELISDIISRRCGVSTPFGGITPKAISTVDQYQGQQNDYIILSLVRTKSVGHLRDVRRLVVAVSRARLGLYILGRYELFAACHELKPTMQVLSLKNNDHDHKLQLVLGENYPTNRVVGDDEIPAEKIFTIEDMTHMGSMVHKLQETWMTTDGDDNAKTGN